MANYEIFSKRQKRLRGEVPDVFTYDNIPPQLRIQVIHIWGDTIGHENERYITPSANVYIGIHNALCREYGCFNLSDEPYSTAENKLRKFFGTCGTEGALDVIELSFRFIDGALRDSTARYEYGSTISADQAIAELNERFRWHGVGYQYESGFIIRVDSQFLHAETVKPTLALLTDQHYAGANEEFLKAFEHYRHGDTKGCLNECLKAFESTMKAICVKRHWPFNKADTAKTLIGVCLQQKLIPDLIQTHISAFRSTLESGIPTVRNKLSGHGQGPTVLEVPPYYASYMLHLTATTIQLLVEAEKELK
jgi:hypothetical protein